MYMCTEVVIRKERRRLSRTQEALDLDKERIRRRTVFGVQVHLTNPNKCIIRPSSTICQLMTDHPPHISWLAIAIRRGTSVR